MVILASPDALLTETTTEMTERYPGVTITAVGADLSKPGFMEALDKVPVISQMCISSGVGEREWGTERVSMR